MITSFKPRLRRVTRKCASVSAATVVLAIGLTLVRPVAAHAAEGATSFYLLGLHGPLAALVPPPGIYVQNDAYIYGASAGASTVLPFTGHLAAGIKADAYLDLPTLLWETPWVIGGGHVGLTVTQPFGVEYVKGRVEAGPYQLLIQGSRAARGDLAVGLPISWSAGRLHWSFSPLLNIPIGDYDRDALANIALHRWAGDFSGAVTWLDPKTGFESSAIVGVTANGINQATDYRTGTEFHTELDASQFLSRQFSIGILGAFEQQLTADSGAGPLLQGFEGRVFSAGGTVGYQTTLFGQRLLLRGRGMREFGVQNRLTGTVGIFTATLSL